MAVSGHRPGGSVLLVEDDDGPRARWSATMLADVGLEVVHASSASEAVTRGAGAPSRRDRARHAAA